MDHDDDVYSLLTITSQFYIVTGGNDGSRDLDSTEIMNKDGGTSWHTVASMPFISYALSGVSLPNGHFMVSGDDLVRYISIYLEIITGGYNNGDGYLADVLDYDPEADKWTKVGQLAKPRAWHAMSRVPKETTHYCV